MADEARYAALAQRFDCIDKRTAQLEHTANEYNAKARLYDRQEFVLRRIRGLEGGDQTRSEGNAQKKAEPRVVFPRLHHSG